MSHLHWTISYSARWKRLLLRFNQRSASLQNSHAILDHSEIFSSPMRRDIKETQLLFGMSITNISFIGSQKTFNSHKEISNGSLSIKQMNLLKEIALLWWESMERWKSLLIMRYCRNMHIREDSMRYLENPTILNYRRGLKWWDR